MINQRFACARTLHNFPLPSRVAPPCLPHSSFTTRKEVECVHITEGKGQGRKLVAIDQSEGVTYTCNALRVRGWDCETVLFYPSHPPKKIHFLSHPHTPTRSRSAHLLSSSLFPSCPALLYYTIAYSVLLACTYKYISRGTLTSLISTWFGCHITPWPPLSLLYTTGNVCASFRSEVCTSQGKHGR